MARLLPPPFPAGYSCSIGRFELRFVQGLADAKWTIEIRDTSSGHLVHRTSLEADRYVAFAEALAWCEMQLAAAQL